MLKISQYYASEETSSWGVFQRGENFISTTFKGAKINRCHTGIKLEYIRDLHKCTNPQNPEFAVDSYFCRMCMKPKYLAMYILCWDSSEINSTWNCRFSWQRQLTSQFAVLMTTFYTFRAYCARHQEREIVSIQPLVAVGGHVVCRSEVNSLPTCTWNGHRHRVTATRGIDRICLSWWWAWCAQNV
jgi:hypothetical protein